jgi:hypothetical protein
MQAEVSALASAERWVRPLVGGTVSAWLRVTTGVPGSELAQLEWNKRSA